MSHGFPRHLFCRLRVCRAALNNATVSWSRSTFVRASCTELPVVERKPLVLKASEFQHLFEEGPTEKAYASTAVRSLSQHQLGRMCQEWARNVLQEKYPQTEILDPEPGQCCNGRRRGHNNTSYDFLLGACRVEIKSARLAWNSAARRWHVEFSNVKLAYGERAEPAFDDLYLAILSPTGLHLIKHDLVTGVSTRGRWTEVGGHVIKVRGRTDADCWEDALKETLWKLCERGGCSVVDEKLFSELDFQEMVRIGVSQGQAAVAGLPMSSMSREKRGKRIQEIGVTIDRRLHPQSHFSFVKGTCGKANAPADWVRGRQRVELKSCGLSFDGSNNRWRGYFSCIKPHLFNQLWLAIYGVAGVRFYVSKSAEHLQLANAGAATAQRGHALVFAGPCGELDPLEAFKTIEAKMIYRGCELVAILEWEKGAFVTDDASLSLGDKDAG